MHDTAGGILEREGVARAGPDELKDLPAKAAGPVLVAFVAAWCEVSREQAPVLARLAKRFGDRVRFAFADVDRNAGDAGRLNVRSVPAVIIFAKERELERKVGAAAEDELARVVEKALEEYRKIEETQKPDENDEGDGAPAEPARLPESGSDGKSDGEAEDGPAKG